jgi:hypothetical protein
MKSASFRLPEPAATRYFFVVVIDSLYATAAMQGRPLQPSGVSFSTAESLAKKRARPADRA